MLEMLKKVLVIYLVFQWGLNKRIKMKIISIPIYLISFCWSIGLQGLILPENSHVLSTANSGIAEGESSSLNPALNDLKNSYIQFSMNHWLGDIKGSQTAFYWGKNKPQSICIQSWNAKDIQLWGNNPDATPLGTFGVHYASASYSISHNLSTPYRWGMRIQANYTHLFSESISGLAIDIGGLFPINSFMKAGLVLKNIGYKFTNNLKSELPTEAGLGLGFSLPFNISILTDIIYLSKGGIDTRIGFKTNWKLINIHAGSSIHEKRNANALGFLLNYKSWSISYGIYNHENSNLGIPQFFDIRHYF